jgi:hypothetical protein
VRRLFIGALGALSASLGAVAYLLACKPEVVNQVDLTFAGSDAGVVSGFGCSEPEAGCRRLRCGEPLADKILPSSGGSGRVSLVVDFISTEGNPRCDLESVSQWCMTHDCSPIAGTRVCLEVPEVPLTSTSDAVAAVSQAIQALPGTLITSNAPTVPVIVRVIATAQGCDAGLAGVGQPDCTQLVGCALSCPTELGSFSGPLELAPIVDLSGLGPPFAGVEDVICAPAVGLCAQTPLGGSPATCVLQ